MEGQSHQYGRLRFWEILPGTLTWGTFFMAAFTSLFIPWIAVVFIIIFDLYWTMRVIYFLIHVSFAYKKYRATLQHNWMLEVKRIKDWQRVYHLVMLPTYKEGIDILHEALHSLANSTYPNENFIVVVGGEEGDKENFEAYQKILQAEFKDTFHKLMFTMHPRGLPGEMVGKGSNLKWMASQVHPVIDAEKIPYENIIVDAFDVDTIAHEQYFAKVTHMFLTEPNPLRTSYQPLTLFSNNIWTASAPVRISSFGTTFWLLGELVRPERMWTFSSHSMPWQMLVDVGYHEPDLVSEDSRIFMQGFLHYEGDYRVTPVYLPVHMDAVEGESFVDSLKALYKQQRRWAWGVEHLPYMIAQFRKHPKIPKRLKRRFLFNHIEGMYTWTTAPILIFLLGYVPFFVAGDTTSALIANAPFSLELMMQVATIGVFASGFMSFFFLPPRPQTVKRWNWWVMVAQWALLPITFVVFGAFPAIDAQTRFMFGKYLGFNVTKKLKRK
jgi:cellulose synthase/poly-beta-1,6-N-acetylglucosamine synthase-like glycosyltransferase